MDQEIRNKLRSVVTQCRKLLENDTRDSLEGRFRIYEKKGEVVADPNAPMTHLEDATEVQARAEILDHFGHVKARGFKPKEALDQLVREIAFTHLNRLCAYKMMEAREVYVGGQKFREAVSRGVNSNGVKFYLADHPEDERLFNTGHQDIAYRHFLNWLGGLLSDEIGVLFNPNDPANRLYPRQKTLDEVLDLLNGGGIKPEETELRESWPKIWTQDETIGWVYQYFTPKELRDAARDPKKGGSSAPRNSYELAFRNQFFTPRYVVEFLTDNTLGRIWYEMRKGNTKLQDRCRYMVRRPTEIFLKEGEQLPTAAAKGGADLSQEELLKLPVHIPHRPKKDPRELKILDPACGSGHFLLYCFDLLLTIYEEAYADPDLGAALQQEIECGTLEGLRRQLPRLILAHNLHGIDIDLRASQMAALAMWLRSQRAYQDMGLKKDRPKITRSNFVCAEPMPGEEQMLKDFVAQLEPRLLGQVVEVVFEKMKLAGETGSLLKIEYEIRAVVADAKKQWLRETTHEVDKKGQSSLFTQAVMDRVAGKSEQPSLFDLSGISDGLFFEQAETKVKDALRSYSEKVQNGLKFQWRLFADDAVRGFAFIDLCQKRYDVVLMNPPFGEPSITSREYLYANLPSATQDILAAFIERCVPLLVPEGVLGAITNRLIIVKDLLEDWRSTHLLGASSVMHVFADLGYGVLDEAVVEAAAYILHRGQTPTRSCFLSVLDRVDKQEALVTLMNSVQRGASSVRCFLHDPDVFSVLPKKRIAYWCSEGWLRNFSSLPAAKAFGVTAKKGLETGRDFDLLRLFWEVPSGALLPMKRWTPYSKGGAYRPLHSDIHLVFDWSRQSEARRTSNSELYGKPGLTYTERTTSNFSCRILPAQSVFSPKGPGIFDQSSVTPWGLLGWLSSSVIGFYIELLVGGGDSSAAGTAARDFSPTLIETMPVPKSFRSLLDQIAPLAQRMHDNLASFRHNESSWRFAGFLRIGDSLAECANRRFEAYESAVLDTIRSFCELDSLVDQGYDLSDEQKNDVLVYLGRPYPRIEEVASDKAQHILSTFREESWTANEEEEDEDSEDIQSRAIKKLSYVADPRYESLSVRIGASADAIARCRQHLGVLPRNARSQEALDLLSYCVGSVFGRWDVRIPTSGIVSGSSDVFATPKCPPAMLQDEAGLPARSTTDYPLRVNWDGMLVDDSEHEHDIVRRVRDAMEVIWGPQADTIETEACGLLNVKELREFFRKTAKGGFWDDHVARYTKSRRKAPIYWILQSSKRNYALWLYYHRLTKDTLFKALINHAEPKVRLESSRLEALRSQATAMGKSGKEVKRIAKEIERQEDLLSELHDFVDKLRDAANLQLEPDLNDGVVLNIAPLHELVPWKPAQNYWKELLEGKYDWSAIGKQLRQKGLVK